MLQYCTCKLSVSIDIGTLKKIYFLSWIYFNLKVTYKLSLNIVVRAVRPRHKYDIYKLEWNQHLAVRFVSDTYHYVAMQYI